MASGQRAWCSGRVHRRGGALRLIDADDALGKELTTGFIAVVVDRLQAARGRLLDVYGYPTALPLAG